MLPAHDDAPRANDIRWSVLVVVLLVIGTYLRASPSLNGFPQPGYDEQLYIRYVDHIEVAGTASLARTWLEGQQQLPDKVVPPSRLVPLVAAALWKRLFAGGTFEALQGVSCVASVLALVIALVFARRMGGRRTALAVLALMCVSPLQVYVAHRALLDGAFSCTALLVLWLFWESLRTADPRWGLALGGATALMLLTKETGVFVVAALAIVLATQRWLRVGQASAATWAALGGGTAVAAAAFTFAFGGLSPLIGIARVDMFKPLAPWALERADGPWYHVLLAMFILDPLVLPLALGAATSLRRRDRGDVLMVAFTVLTYGCLACLRYHAVPRYATLWDFPVAWLAWSQVRRLTAPLRRQAVVRVVVLACLCTSQLLQLLCFFVERSLYEPLVKELLQVVRILK